MKKEMQQEVLRVFLFVWIALVAPGVLLPPLTSYQLSS